MSILLWMYSVDSLLKEITDLWLEASLQQHERHPRAASLVSDAVPARRFLRYGMVRAWAKLAYSLALGLLVFEATERREAGCDDGGGGCTTTDWLVWGIPAWGMGALQLTVQSLYALLRTRVPLVAYLGTPYRLRANDRFYGVAHPRAPMAIVFWLALVLTAGCLSYYIIDKPAMGGCAPAHASE